MWRGYGVPETGVPQVFAPLWLKKLNVPGKVCDMITVSRGGQGKMKTRKRSVRMAGALAVLIVFAMLFAGCEEGPENGSGSADPVTGNGDSGETSADTLTEATADLLSRILEDSGATLGEANPVPQTFEDPVTAENAPGMLGILSDDFVGYVTEATVASAAISTFAFEVALVKCGDAESAKMVDTLIKDGFDSGKWICVMPEQSLTSVSGSYILLAVGWKEQTVAIAEAFKAMASGNATAPEVFYEGETGGESGEELPLPTDEDSGDAGGGLSGLTPA
jgi:hypothetical protein